MWTSASQDDLVGFVQLTILSDQGHISELVVISHVSNGRLQRGGGICLILMFLSLILISQPLIKLMMFVCLCDPQIKPMDVCACYGTRKLPALPCELFLYIAM